MLCRSLFGGGGRLFSAGEEGIWKAAWTALRLAARIAAGGGTLACGSAHLARVRVQTCERRHLARGAAGGKGAVRMRARG